MVEFLRTVPPLQHVDEQSLRRLADDVEEVSLAAGEVLFRAGERGDACYIVRTGALQVRVVLDDGTEHVLATLQPTDLVGEMAVIDSRPRTATVQAVTDATLVEISAAGLGRLVTSAPTVLAAFREIAAQRLPALYLATVPMFAGLDSAALTELDLAANWVRLEGGQTLFRQGDRPDYLYIVVRGRLEVVVGDPGHEDVVNHLGRGAVVGEVALFSGEPRTATVRAIRDSELLRLSREALHAFVMRQPQSALEMLRVLSTRVRPVPPSRRDTLVSTIAVVPPRGSATTAWATRLVDALSAHGPTLHATRAFVERELAGHGELENDASRAAVGRWLHEQEDRFKYTVFECDPTPSSWTDLCLRHADLVLIAAVAGDEPAASELHRRIVDDRGLPRRVPAELVLLHPDGASNPRGTARWLNTIPVRRHHHVRLDRDGDFARLARFIVGKAVSVAFSGGGARALAHIGVIRAMQDCGIPIDAVAGVSAGCFVSAFHAMGHEVDKMLAIAWDGIGTYKPTQEVTFPMVAFLSGERSVFMFKKMFDVEIEDLWLPFCCLSTNLSRATIVIHDRGSLWKAIRASTSVPGIYSPVCVNGELLVDGGVLNNLPADVMRARYNGTVVASDVSMAVDLTTDQAELTEVSGWPLFWSGVKPFGKKQKRSLPHIFEILMRTATLSSVHHGETVVASADLYMRLPVDGVATLDWAAGPLLVERSHAYALEQISKWRSAGGSWE
jgi:NTE family protein/lysophospholipid hydrolase